MLLVGEKSAPGWLTGLSIKVGLEGPSTESKKARLSSLLSSSASSSSSSSLPSLEEELLDNLSSIQTMAMDDQILLKTMQ